jgi:hypothetical protein
MPLRLNLSGNALMAPAGGYPFRLWDGGQLMAEGIVTKSVTQVTATLYAESGVADAHMAIFTMPQAVTLSVLDADGEKLVDRDPEDDELILKTYQADALAVGQTETTLTLDMPTNRARSPYVLRLWVDNITGRVADEEDRDADDSTADETLLPTGVVVTEIAAG